MSRFAKDVPDLDLATYQRVVRLVLRHPFITASHPDAAAIGKLRRFEATLRADLAEAFGYRLELRGSTARVIRPRDVLDAWTPVTVRKGRPFDRRRYAYLVLCLAALGRAGHQIALSELAGAVSSDAARIEGLGLDTDRHADRRAFVDAAVWLENHGVVSLTAGSTSSWSDNPDKGEALYDIAKDALFAVYRPARAPQTVTSVAALLGTEAEVGALSENEQRRRAAILARRAVVDRPVVYFRDVAEPVANHLRGTALAADIEHLTGLRVERRAEGVLLVDTAKLSIERFPGTTPEAQAAVLLAVDIADRVLDPDGRRVKKFIGPTLAERHAGMVAEVDAGLPAVPPILPETHPDPGVDDGDDETRLPFITDSFLRERTDAILAKYGTSFGAEWHAEPERLCAEAVRLLTRFGGVIPVPGGVLALPLLGRYRNTIARAQARRSPKPLF